MVTGPHQVRDRESTHGPDPDPYGLQLGSRPSYSLFAGLNTEVAPDFVTNGSAAPQQMLKDLSQR